MLKHTKKREKKQKLKLPHSNLCVPLIKSNLLMQKIQLATNNENIKTV